MVFSPEKPELFEGIPDVELFFEDRSALPEDPELLDMQPILLHFVNHGHLTNHPEIVEIIREYVIMNDASAENPEHVEAEIAKITALMQTVREVEKELEQEAVENELPRAILAEASEVVDLYKEGQLTRDGILISTGENYWSRLQNRSEKASLEALLLYLNDALFSLFASLKATKRRLNQAQRV